MTDELQYPTAENVLAIHEGIVAGDPETELGVRTPESIESALAYVSEGYFGRVPETVHEKTAQLMRLLAADHPFVDGNKRTALHHLRSSGRPWIPSRCREVERQ